MKISLEQFVAIAGSVNPIIALITSGLASLFQIKRAFEDAFPDAVHDARDGTPYPSREEALAAGVPAESIETGAIDVRLAITTLIRNAQLGHEEAQALIAELNAQLGH